MSVVFFYLIIDWTTTFITVWAWRAPSFISDDLLKSGLQKRNELGYQLNLKGHTNNSCRSINKKSKFVSVKKIN